MLARRLKLARASLLVLFILLLGHTATAYVYWRNATKRTVGSVVPRPKQITYLNGIDYLEISANSFELVADESVPNLTKCISVTKAIERYRNGLLFDDSLAESKDQQPANSARRKLATLAQVNVTSGGGGGGGGGQFKCELLPHAQMDESYELLVKVESVATLKRKTATLRANTNWGILRGLETLSQLIFQLEPITATFAIQPVHIIDEPRFKHRGFMLDTARHYISIDNIILLLDAMAYNKLNVFHWHIVDDQSFPLVSKTYPQLAQNSAFKPALVYKPNEVAFIVTYAALRGIRVVPELDTPGHSYTLRHIPKLLTECYDPKSGQKNLDFGPVDPTRPSAYKAVARLLDEFGTLFVESHFHAGGDEVDFDCWKSSPEISNWMEAHNMTGNYEELSNYYIRRLYNMLTKERRKTMIVWQEVYDMGANLPRDNTIIHVWKDINNRPAFLEHLSRVVDAGYNALLSSCWYLNYIDYGQDWIKFYQCDPRGAPINPAKAQQVLGGEICMWTEFVDDSNVVSRTWPRASAAAERLWSPIDANNTEEFLHRLEQHRCRLITRGINAEPVNGPGYC